MPALKWAFQGSIRSQPKKLVCGGEWACCAIDSILQAQRKVCNRLPMWRVDARSAFKGIGIWGLWPGQLELAILVYCDGQGCRLHGQVISAVRPESRCKRE